MIKKWIDWANYGIAGLIIALLLGAFLFWLIRPSEFPVSDLNPRKSTLPVREFARPGEEYNQIGEPALKLTFAPLSVQLPNLGLHLVYYGKNGRPDADVNHPEMFFGFAINKSPVPLKQGGRLYVLYDKGQIPNQYIFSPNNAETPLWIEAVSSGNQAYVGVKMMGENGQIVQEPKAYASIVLVEKDLARFGGTWEIDNIRVDGTFLVKQKARWYGIDQFIEKYGGEEFKEWQNKQRIDFGEEPDNYSVYIGQGQCLARANSRWELVKPGEDALKSPLLCLKKIDDRVMNFELWDVDGKNKVILNLIKSNEPKTPQALENSFKFVGARTRSQLIFDINGERMLLRPHDWLLFHEGEWNKLEAPEDIDAFVERKLIGPLFIFDRIERKDDHPVVFGTFFNAARTEAVEVELSQQQNATPASQENPSKRKGKEEGVKKLSPEGKILKPQDDESP